MQQKFTGAEASLVVRLLDGLFCVLGEACRLRWVGIVLV